MIRIVLDTSALVKSIFKPPRSLSVEPIRESWILTINARF